jgi:hypothetical protein
MARTEQLSASVGKQDPREETASLLASALFHQARCNALNDTGLLDSAAEQTFDRLTGLVVKLMQVPVSLVSLVDTDRQFFKSQYGLPEPWASLRQTPLSH